MSGGCYALQGMHLSDLLINWESHSAPKTKLCGLVALVALDLVYSHYGVTRDISHSAHIGGYIGGLLIGILVGRSFGDRRCERAVKAIAVLFACVAVCFCVGWSQIWPPRDIWDNDRWCWARQVMNASLFQDSSWHCVRCGDHASSRGGLGNSSCIQSTPKLATRSTVGKGQSDDDCKSLCSLVFVGMILTVYVLTPRAL